MRIAFLLFMLSIPSMASATTYYISPAGSNSNDGLTDTTPWLTFVYAIANTACGDSLFLMNGTYGDGTSTGKIDLNGRVCSSGNEFAFIAQNQRKAKIFDNGTGYALRVRNSAYINVFGIYVRSQDNDYLPTATSELGEVFFIEASHHIAARGNLSRNPNRYGNNHTFVAFNSQDILFEDNESYVFSRHCVSAGGSERVVVRRQYCNPRGGKIPGGFSAGGMPIGSGDSVMSMYPCKDCILENSIADGTTSPLFLNEQNANFANSVLVSGNKVLGSICYKCNAGNGVIPNSRNVADLNHTPQNVTIKDVAIVDFGSPSAAVKCQDCVNANLDHVTVIGAGAGATGIWALDSSTGTPPAQNSITLSNIVVTGVTGSGLIITGHNTWSGTNITSSGNGTNFNPALPSNWTNTSTTSPGLGTCKLWTPDGSVNKGTGTGGTDRGATILYRYVDGVLTTDPLWDPVTGEFPHGEDDFDGTNNVTGDSLKDIHTRLNVNTGGCNFPTGYGGASGGGTVIKGTTAASDLVTTATPLTWSHTISASQDRLLVCVGLWDSGFNVGSVSGIDVSGQAMTLIKRQATTPAYRAVEIWGLVSPTNGVRTVTVTLTGAIVGALGRSMEFDVTSGLNTAVSVATPGTGSALTVTAPTNTNEIITDCTVSSKSVTFTHGSDQTGYDSLSHDTVSLLLASSTQSGSVGGVMSSNAGSTVYQAKVAVSLIAGTPDPTSGAVLTGTQYQIFNGFGTESSVTQSVVKNTQARFGPEGFGRVRGEIEASVDVSSPFTPALYCSLNGGGYSPVLDVFSSNVFRYYGAGPESSEHPIPATGSGVLQKLNTGQFQGGVVLRDSTTAYVVPALNPGERVELEAVLQLSGAANDVVTCRWYNSNGTALTYGANGTASILLTPAGAIAGY